ncbi:hypothetical protein SCHPADRAFT_638916 [Schizopora paradoxa]|uniref:Uncharacterized protein n=1 Tax=Schizopora paradoxa TaxID=27342 RepID=A0A0H2R735_9AGAM|nr:hypothetical protein SCHPADRAFT_638916 [Schizopora paradoxa]
MYFFRGTDSNMQDCHQAVSVHYFQVLVLQVICQAPKNVGTTTFSRHCARDKNGQRATMTGGSKRTPILSYYTMSQQTLRLTLFFDSTGELHSFARTDFIIRFLVFAVPEGGEGACISRNSPLSITDIQLSAEHQERVPSRQRARGLRFSLRLNSIPTFEAEALSSVRNFENTDVEVVLDFMEHDGERGRTTEQSAG